MTAKDTCEPTSTGDKSAPQAEQQDPSSGSCQATGDTTIHPPPRSSKTKRKKKKKEGPASASQCRQSSAEVCLYTGVDTFKVTTNPAVGRCVVASRDLSEGELVLDEQPFAKVCPHSCVFSAMLSASQSQRSLHSEGTTAGADFYIYIYICMVLRILSYITGCHSWWRINAERHERVACRVHHHFCTDFSHLSSCGCFLFLWRVSMRSHFLRGNT